MKKDPERTESKRAEIIAAAQELFFERGYDATTVRMIQRKVGSEPGLFYYYFHSKDEIFDLAVWRFLEGYRPGFAQALETGRKNPQKLLSGFFEFVHESTLGFRARYEGQLHWSVRRAIREQALELMEPYLEEGLGILIEAGLPEPPLSRRTLAVLLTHGIGSLILHIDETDYQASLDELRRAVGLLLGQPVGGPIDWEGNNGKHH